MDTKNIKSEEELMEKLEKNCEMSEEELNNVAGGFCLGVGIENGSGTCLGIGTGDDTCIWLGV